MKWKRMLFTIVANIFLMFAVSLMMEYSDLTERFVMVEDTVQEALDLAISASVHSEEFFTAQYQGKLMSYAGIGATNNDTTAAATTLVWLQDSNRFAQVNTYQFARWYQSTGRLPTNDSDVNNIMRVGNGERYGLVGYIFEWLYGGAGSDYLAPGLTYGNRNSARIYEYTAEGNKARGSLRNQANLDFKQYYQTVGHLQQTAGYLKQELTGRNSYSLVLQTYPTLCNMGLSWMESINTDTSPITADNLCSSLHIGKSRASSKNTYYFLTPSSLGVTYVPAEVLKPVFVANLDTITRLNRLGASTKYDSEADAIQTLHDAGQCIETSVYDFNTSHDAYTSNYNTTNGQAAHIPSSGDETIVTDGLVEFDLSTAQVKIDYFYYDFGNGGADAAMLISKLNGTLTPSGSPGNNTEAQLRDATLQAFLTQDTSRYVSPFLGSSFTNQYDSVGDARIIARVTAKVKVHVPYKSSILQWACYMFTGTNHFDIKRYDPANGTAFTTLADSDGLWYQYTTYFCTSRS